MKFDLGTPAPHQPISTWSKSAQIVRSLPARAASVTFSPRTHGQTPNHSGPALLGGWKHDALDSRCLQDLKAPPVAPERTPPPGERR